MPQRAINAWFVVVGVLGLVVLAALAVYGADLRRASRTGPRWKRRLLTAALALLSGLSAGLAGRGSAAAAEAEPARAASPKPAEAGKAPLPEMPQWKRLTATWKEAEEVASGRRGRYPFNAEGRKALLAALGERAKDVDALAADRLLTAAEAGLLKKEIDRLTQGVGRMRPVEMKMATCYRPAPPITSPYYSLRRLEDRLGLLTRLAEARTIHPAAARKVVATLEADLKTLEGSDYLKRLKGREKAEKTLQAAKALAEKIKARLGKTPLASGLETTAQWKVIIDAWKFAKPLADSHKSTTAQRKEADKKLAAAKQAAAELAKAAAISPAESGLLAAEADTIRGEIYRTPPTDMQVTCYLMAAMHPAWQSFDRLSKRLPLLQKLAESGKVSPAVMAKILPTVKADLARLTRPNQAKALQPKQKAEAPKVTAQARAAVAKIEKLLAAPAAKGK